MFNKRNNEKIVRLATNSNIMNKGLKSGSEAVYETMAAEDLDPNNTELVELHLRDSLIKSFMVIFTNE